MENSASPLCGPGVLMLGLASNEGLGHAGSFVCTGAIARRTTGLQWNLGHVIVDGLKLSEYGGES